VPVVDGHPYLLCAFCDFGETKLPMSLWHIMAIHAALDHRVNLREIFRSRRVEAPSHTVMWRLPDGTGWAIEFKKTGMRPG